MISIKRGFNQPVNRFIHCETGSFTLESSLIFPFVFISTVILMFATLYIYQVASLHSTSGITADRTAFVWDNSSKDPATGRFSPGSQDGLYRRVTSDLFSAGLGLFGANGGAKVSLPVSSNPSGQSLIQTKLTKSALQLPSHLQGEIKFESSGWLSKIVVSLNEPFQMPFRGTSLAMGSHASYITEPIEFIRVIDLTRTYMSEIKDRMSPKKAAELFQDREISNEQGTTFTFKSEAEAAEYIRKLVSGVRDEKQTPSGPMRVIDALDANGIAHQAYYNTNSNLEKVQLPKDIELMRAGMVQGVVWHFFKGGKNLPSEKLQQKLDQAGIIVVIHQ